MDSVQHKGDVVGLYNHCVTVRLGDGRVVEQNIYPGQTHCQDIFIQAWTQLLNSQWNQVMHKLFLSKLWRKCQEADASKHFNRYIAPVSSKPFCIAGGGGGLLHHGPV